MSFIEEGVTRLFRALSNLKPRKKRRFVPIRVILFGALINEDNEEVSNIVLCGRECDEVGVNEVCDKVRQALQTLPERERMIIALKNELVDGKSWTFNEIAAFMKIPLPTVHRAYWRGMAILAQNPVLRQL